MKKGVSIFSVVLILVSVSTAWGFSTSGVPCYLHPSGDGCHYSQKPDSPSCTNTKTRAQLEIGTKQLNRSMFSLEQQLIRLGVIPPDNACSELPPVDNGGVVYTDLNLAPGCTGKYICNEGYFLHALRGHREFNCTEDGIWNGNVTTTPVICVLMVDRCDPPNEIQNGNISFMDNDRENVLPGDMVTYICDEGYEMIGSESRYCLRTGNWSEQEPECLRKKPVTESQEVDKRGMIAGVSVSSVLLFLTIAGIVVAVIIFIAIKWVRPAYKKRRESKVYSPTRPLLVSDEPLSPSHSSHVTQYSVINPGRIAAEAAEAVKQKKQSSDKTGKPKKKSSKLNRDELEESSM